MEDNMNNLILTLTAASEAAPTGNTFGVLIQLVLPLVAMGAIFYFLIIRPEKKRNKEMQDMLNNLQVADEVITNGGIIGRVLSVKEDTVLIETGSDRTKIRVVRSAIAKNNTVHEAPAEVAPEPKKKKDGKKTEIK